MALISGMFFDQVEVGDHYSIAQLHAPEEFLGKKIIDLHLRQNYQINVVTIKRRVAKHTMWGEEVFHEQIIAVPKPDDLILEGDILVLFGGDNDLSRLAEMVEKKK